MEPFVEGLGRKAGPLVFQFSPMSMTELGSARRFAEALYRFLHRLPKGPHYAVELRTPELLVPDYAAALKAAAVSHCFNSWRVMPDLRVQWQVCREAVGQGLVLRWMVPRGKDFKTARAAPATLRSLGGSRS